MTARRASLPSLLIDRGFGLADRARPEPGPGCLPTPHQTPRSVSLDDSWTTAAQHLRTYRFRTTGRVTPSFRSWPFLRRFLDDFRTVGYCARKFTLGS